MAFEGLAVGDIHYDKIDRYFPGKGIEYQDAELRKVFDYAANEGLSHVFLMGDVADHPHLSVNAQKSFLSLLTDYAPKFNIYVILGNHDFADEENNSLDMFSHMKRLNLLPDNVHLFDKPEQRKIDGVYFNFLPYPYTEVEGAKHSAINLGHFEVAGSIRDNGLKIRHGLDPKDNAYILGHLHTPHDVGKCHYTGTLYQTNFGESLPKSFTRITAKTKGGVPHFKCRRIPNDPAFKLINLTIGSKRDLKLIENNPRYLYKLFVQEGVDLSKSTIPDNVFDTIGYESKEELDILQTMDLQDVFVDETVNYEASLKSWLITKGLAKSKLKRALKLAATLQDKLKETSK